MPALILGAVVLVVERPAWLGRAQLATTRWEYWGRPQLQVDAVRAGELPLCGTPTTASISFHAIRRSASSPQWGLVAIASCSRNTPWWLITVKALAHLWLGALGMYALTPAPAGTSGGPATSRRSRSSCRIDPAQPGVGAHLLGFAWVPW
ncbi:MAG: hypothetical protein R2939_05705 [Kofleriaceae bacterium]